MNDLLLQLKRTGITMKIEPNELASVKVTYTKCGFHNVYSSTYTIDMFMLTCSHVPVFKILSDYLNTFINYVEAKGETIYRD